MANRHVGLTNALAESYLEAARVSLDRHHESPQHFSLKDGSSERAALVEWESPDERCLGAWANTDDATRDGAYACAIAASEFSFDLYAVRRAETRTGADYYLASVNMIPEDLENCFRLEVSGTNLDEYEVRRVLNTKVKQVKEGKGNLPALAIVVGFKVKMITMKVVEKSE